MGDLGIVGELLLNSGPLAALAGFALWISNQVWKARLADECRHADELRALQGQTLEALQRNTEAMTRLAERLGSEKPLKGK